MSLTTSPITRLQSDIKLLFDLANATSNVQQLSSIVKIADEKQRSLDALLREKTTPPTSPSLLSKLYTSTPGPAMSEAEAGQIKSAVSSQIAQIKAKFELIKQSPLRSTTSSPYGSSSTGGIPSGLPSTSSPTAVRAVGFRRENNNCWCNSLLQMVVHIPSVRTAYEVIGRHYQNDRENAANALHGAAMMKALSDYDSALQTGTPLPTSVSQSIRLAMHHFFPIISASSWQTEDAYEALQLLMTKYQDVAFEQGLTFVPSLYTPIETKRVYEPQGSPRAAEPEKLQRTKLNPHHRDAYSSLSPDLSSSLNNPEYQIFLDLQNQGHLSFGELVRTYFRSGSQGGEPGVYLRSDDQIQDFKLKSENRQFQANPQELVLSVKRFGFNREKMQGFKITSPLAIPRSFSLPQEATVSGSQPTYDLDFFIVHSGGYGGGHYVAYRKIQDAWFEFNDSAVRPISNHDIDRILGNATASIYTSYIHHYSLRSQLAQSSALSAQSGIAQSLPPLMPSIDSLLTVAKSQVNTCDKTKKNLEELNRLIKDPSSSKEEIDRCMATLPKHIVNTLDYLIWIDGKMPQAPNYGTSIRENNPRFLNEIRTPWILPTGGNLIEQLIATEETKKQKAEKQENVYKLEHLIQQLNTSSVSESQLKQTLEELPQELQKHIEYLVYLSHKIKYGEAAVHDVKYNHNYGKNILVERGIRDVLLSANEAVLNAHGKNIVEQLKSSKEMEIIQDKHVSDSQSLQAYLALLRRPEEEISTDQLVSAFNSLNINPDLKEKFYMLIYVAAGMPEVENYGEKEFKKNPRLLLTTVEPLLIGPPRAMKGTSLIEQMITLLS
ncbi:MAG: hypothetical protein JSR39_00635 [Verrucomicrobia bacterium]|nr:hypothetical protein [Verrucomicrobiota bacterium]